MVRSYLTDKRIIAPRDGDERMMTRGFSQGSVLGLTMWNIFYDGLLRLRLPEGVSLVGFTDDIAIVTVNHTTEGKESATNKVLRQIGAWIDDHGLELAALKIGARDALIEVGLLLTRPIFRWDTDSGQESDKVSWSFIGLQVSLY